MENSFSMCVCAFDAVCFFLASSQAFLFFNGGPIVLPLCIYHWLDQTPFLPQIKQDENLTKTRIDESIFLSLENKSFSKQEHGKRERQDK